MTLSRRSLLATLGAAALLAGCGSAPTQPAAPVAAAPAPLPLRHVKIALALGGGAARGFAHIGVIKALEAQGIVTGPSRSSARPRAC